MTALLEVRQPELKINEFSRQYVRDAVLDVGFNPPKDTEEPKSSEETEIVEDALFGVEDPRPPFLPQAQELEPGATRVCKPTRI